MEFGNKLKQLRLTRGLTQEDVAVRCGLSKGYISQIENDLTSPSIATLVDILNVLGTNIRQFFTSDPQEDRVVYTEEDFLVKSDDGTTVTWIVPNCQKYKMEPIIIELNQSSSSEADEPHEGEEFGYVLSGTVSLVYGDKEYTLHEGESFYFKSAKPHLIKNIGTTSAKVLWVSNPPTF